MVGEIKYHRIALAIQLSDATNDVVVVERGIVVVGNLLSHIVGQPLLLTECRTISSEVVEGVVVRIAAVEADVLAHQVEDREAVGGIRSLRHLFTIGVDELSVEVVGGIIHLVIACLYHL